MSYVMAETLGTVTLLTPKNMYHALAANSWSMILFNRTRNATF
jgi:hypothetical protein